MDIICGITAKTDGTVTYFGETDNADKGNVKERIGYCASQAMFPANWKVRDIALSMSLAFDKFSKDRFYSLLGELGVTDEKTVKAFIEYVGRYEDESVLGISFCKRNRSACA